jgi:cytochrome bd ubiquinol oxidase subunit II
MVYAIFLPAFYLPIALMLLGLIFRGVAFEFRQRSQRMRPVWDWGFFLGSMTAAFVQGAAIGTMVQELPVVDGRYAGGAFEWVTPFSMLCGAGLVLGYALLGAAWLVLKTEGDLRDWAYRRLDWLLAAVVVVLIAVFAFALATQLRVFDRWLTDPRFVVLQLLGVVAIIGLLIGVRRRRDGVPFAAAILLVASAFLRLGVSFWPYMVPYSVTVQQASAPVQSLEFLFWGAGIIVFPAVLIYTGVVYWIFRGKVGKIAQVR